jgi:accessory gene regulator protein AgrB
MTENQKQPLNSDEIDLLELLARIVISIKSNFKLIVGAFIIGSLLGLAYYQFVPKSYESRMLISSEILTESYSKTIAEDLNKLIRERNIESLSSKLKITPKEALALGKLEVKNAIEKADGRKEEEKNYLTISCQTSNNSIWPSLQNGLINFLENNDYVKIRVEQKKKYFTQVIEKIDKELVDLNELKSRIANGQITQSSKDNLILFDPTTVNTKILDLNKEKINLQNQLEIVNSIQVVEGFTVFEKPIGPKLSISLSAGASFGLFFVILIIGFKSLRKIVSLSEEKLAKS